jgi:hypothetical protein
MMSFMDPWAEFMGLNLAPESQGAITIMSNLGELEVNLSMLESSINDFFHKTIEGAAPPAPTSPRPSTSEVIKDLTFKKTIAPGPEATNPLFNKDLIPEVEYEASKGDIDMDAEGSPEPESVIISV